MSNPRKPRFPKDTLTQWQTYLNALPDEVVKNKNLARCIELIENQLEEAKSELRCLSHNRY